MSLSMQPLLLLLFALIYTGPGVRSTPTVEICRGVYCYTTSSGQADRPCTGPQCQSRLFIPFRANVGGFQHRGSQPFRHTSNSRSIPDPNTRKQYVRVAVAENIGICTGSHCQSLPQPNDSKGCKGIECKLPLRVRPKPKLRSHCNGEGCPPVSVPLLSDSPRQPSSLYIPDTSAQFIGEVPASGNPAAAELGGASLGVQLTCDIKPGDNEVPSEDALILQLQLSKGQEKFVEMLRSQQKVISDLQRGLTEQQMDLINQQREILGQQREMFEQMELVKVQYGLLSESIKQTSLSSLQAQIQDQFESHLHGLQGQIRTRLQEAYAVENVEVDAEVLDVRGRLMECALCSADEFCDLHKMPPQCEQCTLCPAGFDQISECSPTADRRCQDKDECLESGQLCGDRVKCINTPGGFRCLGIAERDAVSGFCGHGYFFSNEMLECQACSLCPEGAVAFLCSAHGDAVCHRAPEVQLSGSWWASTKMAPGEVAQGLSLAIEGQPTSHLASVQHGRLVLRQHGLIWADYNFAVKHQCRNFLQLSLRFNCSEGGRDLSAARIEQPDGKYYQSASVSGAAEVEPGHLLQLVLTSPNQHCNRSHDLSVYRLQAPFSFIWLSHDTGAVAMSAHTTASVHYQSNYRPVFQVISISDPYMIGLCHGGRAVRFTEKGVVRFVYRQALYAMGHTCIAEGFTLISYVNRNGTNRELVQVYKTGVSYRDTSISASGAARVNGGDVIGFEIRSPAQCSVRYFGDAPGISTLSLLWIPSGVSAALSLRLCGAGLPTGAVRNRWLRFQEVSPAAEGSEVRLVVDGQFAQELVLFRGKGVASVTLNLKLIHSCSIVRVTLNRLQSPQAQPSPLAQQIAGQMPEGSQWASVSLRTSFAVQNGTMASVSLDCVRGRINQIAHEHGSNLSFLWVSS